MLITVQLLVVYPLGRSVNVCSFGLIRAGELISVLRVGFWKRDWRWGILELCEWFGLKAGCFGIR